VKTVSQREAEVREALASGIVDYENLIASIYDCITLAAVAFSQIEPHAKASGNLFALLLARLQGDLRVCVRAALDGYAIQALTLAATIHELSYQAIFIGGSDDRAREWSEHVNESRQYPEAGHFAAIESARGYFALSAEDIAREYGIYRQLCWAKHGNPVLQRQYGAVQLEEVVEIQQIPYYSERTLSFVRYALLHASRAIGATMIVFTQTHLESVVDHAFLERLSSIGPDLNRIGVRDALLTPHIPGG